MCVDHTLKTNLQVESNDLSIAIIVYSPLNILRYFFSIFCKYLTSCLLFLYLGGSIWHVPRILQHRQLWNMSLRYFIKLCPLSKNVTEDTAIHFLTFFWQISYGTPSFACGKGVVSQDMEMLSWETVTVTLILHGDGIWRNRGKGETCVTCVWDFSFFNSFIKKWLMVDKCT